MGVGKEVSEEILSLIKKTRGSSFNRVPYSVSIDLNRFVNSMLLHTWYEKNERSNDEVPIDNLEWLKRTTPAFQRDNNKWTKKMKVKFIENLLSGANTELMLYRMDRYEDALLIDGLQRTTAIIDFFNGKVKPFGYSCKELGGALKQFNTHLTINIYTFDTMEEVGRFYIDMNENITHSKSDIQKAKDWFLKEHQISL